jgi:hypothetical protein
MALIPYDQTIGKKAPTSGFRETRMVKKAQTAFSD